MFDPDPSRRLSRSAWIAAALGAVALHAGGAALAIASISPQDTEDVGASAIEIGVEFAAPHLDPADLPPGPNTAAATPSPAAVPQEAVVEPTTLPQAVPTETDDPDRVVTPNKNELPREKQPKVATAEAKPSTASVASEDTAMPSIEIAPEAPYAVAPALGSGASARRDRLTWQKELAAHFQKYKRYPSDREMRNAEVVVSFALDRVRHVVSMRTVKGSGDPSFDSAALAMLRRSDPVPAPPPLVADEGLTFTLPIVFHVKGRN